MTDQEFLNQFELCTLPKEYFTHQGHLRMTWLYLNSNPYPQALQLISRGIQHYAASLGATQKYHETITQAWARLVHLSMQKQNAVTFDEFISKNQHLLDSKLVLKYYSAELLGSAEAKQRWIEPDFMRLD
jgi:hypothetical protein